MITDILLDMGGVLIDFNPVRFTEIYAPSPNDREILINCVYRSPYWSMMDTGELDLNEAVEKMCISLPQRLHEAARHMVCDWPEIVKPIQGMPELVKELKDNGYRLSLLTNAQISHMKYWKTFEYYPELFENRIMLSSQWHLVKPDVNYFYKAQELLGFIPENSIFADDMPANVRGAEEAGLSGICFKDAESFRNELIKYGVDLLS